MIKEFRKAITNHIDGNYEFIIDCGDLYLRNNVSFEEDLKYCKSIIEAYNPTKIKSIKVLINYTIPFEQDINLFKEKKLENYKNKKDNNFSVLLIEFTQDSNELKLCEEIWFGYEEFNKKIINEIENLESIYFFGRNFTDQRGDAHRDQLADHAVHLRGGAGCPGRYCPVRDRHLPDQRCDPPKLSGSRAVPLCVYGPGGILSSVFLCDGPGRTAVQPGGA